VLTRQSVATKVGTLAGLPLALSVHAGAWRPRCVVHRLHDQIMLPNGQKPIEFLRKITAAQRAEGLPAPIAEPTPFVLRARCLGLLNARTVWRHYLSKCAAARSSCRAEFSSSRIHPHPLYITTRNIDRHCEASTV
jgi:hypothetical protein